MGVEEVAPRFTTKPSLKQEDGGKRLVFLCALEASPQPEITWFLGNTQLQASDKHRMKAESKGGIAYNIIMELIGVAKDDAGTYKVVAKNKLGEVSATINLNLGGAAKKQADGVAPNFTTKPSTKQVGKDLLMECQLTAEPQPSLEWFRDETQITSGGRVTITVESKGAHVYLLKLLIKDVANGDAGNYRVIAKNELGESNATIKLNFDSSAADAGKGKPMFTSKPAIRQQGDKLIIECKLTADPQPEIIWQKNGENIAESERIKIFLKSDGKNHSISLEITKITISDGGLYKAVAKNIAGESTATINLNFEGKKSEAGKAPHFIQKPVIKQPQKNQLTMTCHLESAQAPKIKWFKEAAEITQGGRYNLSIAKDAKNANLYIVILLIQDPAAGDGGIYKCVATNESGESNANITLNFQGTEKKENDEAEMKRLEAEKIEMQMQESLRIEAEKKEAAMKLEAEAALKLEAEKKEAALKLEAEKKEAALKLEAEKKETEKQAALKLEAEKKEAALKLEAEKKEAALKLEAEKKEAALKLEAEKKEAALKLEAEKKEAALKLEAEKKEAEKQAALKKEAEKKEAEKKAAEKKEADKKEAEKKEAEKKEAEKKAAEKKEAEKKEAEKKAAEKKEAEKKEAEKKAAEKKEPEKKEPEKKEPEKKEPEKKDAPTFTDKPKITLDASKKNLSIECVCTAISRPTVTWYKGNTMLKQNIRYKMRTGQDKNTYKFIMDIMGVNKDDNADYKVVVKNVQGEGSTIATVNLDAPKDSKDGPEPLKDKAAVKIELDQGKVTFEQRVDDKPDGAEWFFGNTPLKTGGRYQMEITERQKMHYACMTMNQVTTKDAGAYKVIVKTPFGERVQHMKLSSTQLIPPKVKGDPPKFITKLTSKTFTLGEAMDITLKVMGTEPITTFWFQDGKEIKPSSSVNITYERGTARFYMSKVTAKEAGEYTVELKNPVGSVTGSAKMIVKEDEKKKKKEEEMKRKEEERLKMEAKMQAELETKEMQRKKDEERKKLEDEKKLERKKEEDEKKKKEEEERQKKELELKKK